MPPSFFFPKSKILFPERFETIAFVQQALLLRLKRVKTFPRSITGEDRLNHLVLLHVHKELADGIDMVEAANLFVGDNQRCKHLFGKFSKNETC